MRASKEGDSQNFKIGEGPVGEVHISGAEGIYGVSEINDVVRSYAARALTHPKGKPDKIFITVEKLSQKPKRIASLPVTTLKCSSGSEARESVVILLRRLGIGERAIGRAFSILQRRLPGAALITAVKGRRVDPDKDKGVRVSLIGIEKKSSSILSSELCEHDIDTQAVREAVILASKVASCEAITAELCISDDPDYTTGYVASRSLGYIRIPFIKRRRSPDGGRIFFVDEDSDVKKIIPALRKFPAIVSKTGGCNGIMSTDEILDSAYRKSGLKARFGK